MAAIKQLCSFLSLTSAHQPECPLVETIPPCFIPLAAFVSLCRAWAGSRVKCKAELS